MLTGTKLVLWPDVVPAELQFLRWVQAKDTREQSVLLTPEANVSFSVKPPALFLVANKTIIAHF